MTCYYGESGYLLLLKDIIDSKEEYPDRTGIGCKKLFHKTIEFDLREGFPKATVRPTPLRFAFEEFWMFLRGITDTKTLESKGIDIWKGNTSRGFLNRRGLTDIPEGDMGKAYGYQLRKFGGKTDQLRKLVYDLLHDPFGRRHYVTLWNPNELQEMALTPCWHSHQFSVEKRGTSRILNLRVYSRSADVLFGLPFNYQQYALYLLAMSELLGYEAGKLTCDLTDAHVYLNQIDYVEETLTRDYDAFSLRNVVITKPIRTLHDLLDMEWKDIVDEGQFVNIQEYVTPKPPMAV